MYLLSLNHLHNMKMIDCCIIWLYHPIISKCHSRLVAVLKVEENQNTLTKTPNSWNMYRILRLYPCCLGLRLCSCLTTCCLARLFRCLGCAMSCATLPGCKSSRCMLLPLKRRVKYVILLSSKIITINTISSQSISKSKEKKCIITSDTVTHPRHQDHHNQCS